MLALRAAPPIPISPCRLTLLRRPTLPPFLLPFLLNTPPTHSRLESRGGGRRQTSHGRPRRSLGRAAASPPRPNHLQDFLPQQISSFFCSFRPRGRRRWYVLGTLFPLQEEASAREGHLHVQVRIE